MLQSVNDLKGYDIIAADGEIGSVEEFYFDDESLAVRYLVANTGNWLTGRQNLISPFAITHIDPQAREIRLSLSREQVAKSPAIDKHKPVSRQMEALVADYYGYSYYWTRPDLSPELLASTNAVAEGIKSVEATGSSVGAAALAPAPAPDVHLRSMEEVSKYNIAANDGKIGEVEDFVLETDNWSIRYLAVDTGEWLSGKRVLISSGWLGPINWSQKQIEVNLLRAQIKDSPDYDQYKLITREYETRLNNHYNYKTTS